MKIDLKKNITIIKKSIIEAFEISNVMIIPNTSATISIFVYCDDNTLQERIFMLIGKNYDDYVDDTYLYNYIQTNIEEIFNNN